MVRWTVSPTREVEPGEVVGDAALAAGAGLGLELVDEVDDVEGEAGKRAFQWTARPPNAADAAADAGADARRGDRSGDRCVGVCVSG